MTATTPNLFGESLETKSYFWCCPYPIENLIGQFVTKFWRLCGYSAESLVTSALKNRTVTYWDCGAISTLLNDDVFKNLLKTKDLNTLPRIADAYRFIHNDQGKDIITNAVKELIGDATFDELRVALLANVVVTNEIASKLFPHITKFSDKDFAEKVRRNLPDREYVERALENYGADCNDYEVARRLGKLDDENNKLEVSDDVWIKCNSDLLETLFDTQNYDAKTLLFVLLKRNLVPTKEVEALVERIQASKQLHCSGAELASFLGHFFILDKTKGKLLETLNIHVEFSPAEFAQVPDKYASGLAKCVRYDFTTVAEAAAYKKRDGEQEGLLAYVKETFCNEESYTDADLIALANLRRELGDTEWNVWFCENLQGCTDRTAMLLYVAQNIANTELFSAAFLKLFPKQEEKKDEIFTLFDSLIDQELSDYFKLAYKAISKPLQNDYQVAVFKKHGVTWNAHRYLQHIDVRVDFETLYTSSGQTFDLARDDVYKDLLRWKYMFKLQHVERGASRGRGFPVFFEMTPGETTEAKLRHMVTNEWGYLAKNGATLKQFAEKAKGCDLETNLVAAAAKRLYPEELGIAVSLDAIPEDAINLVIDADPHANDNAFPSSRYNRVQAIRNNIPDSSRSAWESALDATLVRCTSITDFLRRTNFEDSEAKIAFQHHRIDFSEFERVMSKIEGNEELQKAAYVSVLRDRRCNDLGEFSYVFGFVINHPEWKGTEKAKAFLKEFSNNYNLVNWRAPLADMITNGHLPNGITQEAVDLLAELELPIRAYDFTGVAAEKNIFAEAGAKLATDLNDLADRNLTVARPIAQRAAEAIQLRNNGRTANCISDAVEMISKASKEAILSAPALPLVVWNTEACRLALVEKLGPQDAYDFFCDNKRDDATERPQIHYIQEERFNASDKLVQETRDAIEAFLKPKGE